MPLMMLSNHEIAVVHKLRKKSANQQKVLSLRESGMTFIEIAKKLHISAPRAWQLGNPGYRQRAKEREAQREKLEKSRITRRGRKFTLLPLDEAQVLINKSLGFVSQIERARAARKKRKPRVAKKTRHAAKRIHVDQTILQALSKSNESLDAGIPPGTTWRLLNR